MPKKKKKEIQMGQIKKQIARWQIQIFIFKK